MQLRMTDVFLKNVEPSPDGRSNYTDLECVGLTLRVHAHGRKTFSYQYKIPGTRKNARVTIGPYPDVKLAEAKSQARAFRAMLLGGQDPRLESRRAVNMNVRRATLSFNNLADRYIEEYAKVEKKSWKNDVGYLKRARLVWGKRIAATLTDDEIARFLDDVARTSPVTANRTQSVLSKMFNWARQPGRKYIEANPISGLERRSKERRRDRVLTDGEIRLLWNGLSAKDLPATPAIAAALKMILTTMCRPGQAVSALVEHIVDLDTDHPEWHIPRSLVKKDRPVIVPLSPLSLTIVKQAIKSTNQLALFPSRYADNEEIAVRSLSAAVRGNRQKGRKGIAEFLGMNRWTPHDLRRTAATIARRGGCRREDVKAALDHIEGDVTAVYDKYDMISEKREVMKTLDREIRKIVG